MFRLGIVLMDQIFYALFAFGLTTLALFSFDAVTFSQFTIALVFIQGSSLLSNMWIVYPAYKLRAFVTMGSSAYFQFQLVVTIAISALLLLIFILANWAIFEIPLSIPAFAAFVFAITISLSLRAIHAVAGRFDVNFRGSTISLALLMILAGVLWFNNLIGFEQLFFAAAIAKLAGILVMIPKLRNAEIKRVRPSVLMQRHWRIARESFLSLSAEYFRVYGFYLVLGWLGPKTLAGQVREIEMVVSILRQFSFAIIVRTLADKVSRQSADVATRRFYIAAAGFAALIMAYAGLISFLFQGLEIAIGPKNLTEGLAVACVCLGLFVSGRVILFLRRANLYSNLSKIMISASVLALIPLVLIVLYAPSALYIVFWLAALEGLIWLLGRKTADRLANQ